VLTAKIVPHMFRIMLTGVLPRTPVLLIIPSGSTLNQQHTVAGEVAIIPEPECPHQRERSYRETARVSGPARGQAGWRTCHRSFNGI
jgi:hypothetical protein